MTTCHNLPVTNDIQISTLGRLGVKQESLCHLDILDDGLALSNPGIYLPTSFGMSRKLFSGFLRPPSPLLDGRSLRNQNRHFLKCQNFDADNRTCSIPPHTSRWKTYYFFLTIFCVLFFLITQKYVFLSAGATGDWITPNPK